ncbi:hypothetical protein DY245_11295 [Streptomyces inhibens]|uniref:Uncharacterized protein n=1 Tax=Streptomyces inhibens TaxID=2293571 RepID=A0A371Q6L8_STRIH|nr:hypothetical protein [Streptomyces inhibens]REK90330.1 hypothetical protein DY245_11295 [Streptomyces inhibens]
MKSSAPRRTVARAAAVLATAMTLAVAAAPLTGTAQAHDAVSGSLSFSGEPGEFVSDGQSHQYTAGATEMFDVSGPTDENSVGLTVVTPEGKRWYLHMAAPDGQKLTDGATFTGASRWPYAKPEDPELQFGETDRSCDTGTGSFTISHIAYGPYGYIRELDATFEQYCNGSTLPLRGEVHARTAEPPAELAVGLNLDTTGKVDTHTGKITVGGNVTCNKPARITLAGNADQTQKRATPAGWYEEQVVNCTPGAPVPWTVSFASMEPGTTFQPGTATVRGIGRADDRDYPVTVDTGYKTAEVTLVKS